MSQMTHTKHLSLVYWCLQTSASYMNIVESHLSNKLDKIGQNLCLFYAWPGYNFRNIDTYWKNQ